MRLLIHPTRLPVACLRSIQHAAAALSIFLLENGSTFVLEDGVTTLTL